MEYQVLYVSENAYHSTSIKRPEFEAAKRSKDIVVELLEMEEKFNILLGNYVEFERELLNLTLHNALSFDGNWNQHADEIHLLNRRLVNLLTTCKLYLDQLHHSLSDLVGPDHHLAVAVRKKCSEEYDERFGYRVLEALRNHVQHRSLPIHRINHRGKWREDRSARDHTATIYIDPKRLADDPKFKKSVLRELKEASDFVDLKPLVRDYVTGIIAVHKYLRRQLVECREQADAEYQALIASLIPTNESSTVVSLRAISDEGAPQFEFSLLTEIITRRQELERKNRSFGELTDLVISSE